MNAMHEIAVDTHLQGTTRTDRTGQIRASGSYLECLTAKRTFGQEWKLRG
jgi:hypothetical protein